MSNERFARQYRFELPSGFHLTSPCTSIVHHLSGPSMHAPARHRPEGQRTACLAPTGARAISVSLRTWVCHPNTRAHVRLLGPCFKTGRIRPVARHDPGCAASGDAGHTASRLSSAPGRPGKTPCPKTLARRVVDLEPIVPPSTGASPATGRKSDSLATNDFTYYFTFFSKFFSSFPHGTCSLSGSRKYLAFEGHYLRIGAAVPSNTTHG